jgi:post-segregation antitoxin (ccd killing protein)
MSEAMRQEQTRLREVARRPYSFFLDVELVERARLEVGELDVVRSIEAALAAAIDYKVWMHEVERGERDILA